MSNLEIIGTLYVLIQGLQFVWVISRDNTLAVFRHNEETLRDNCRTLARDRDKWRELYLALKYSPKPGADDDVVKEKP
jgi:hypothetical protein